MSKWNFKKISPGETVTEPTQGAFFRWESIVDTPGKTVVREGIQNAIDARLESADKIKVRIEIVKRPNDEEENVFSSSWWEHIQAQKNGIDTDSMPQNKGAGAHWFLIFEDFNTTGLTGDETRHVAKLNDGNNFYNFFRAVGSTDKEGATLGKWGIGKHTFWQASRVNTVFGFTVKEGESEMLCLGKTILKSHAIGNNVDKDYQDGFYGIAYGDFTLPLKGDAALNLAAAFGLKRTTETGLSLVVPWIHEDIKPTDIKKCIVDDYFYPILAGRLEVSLGAEENDMHLDANNIEEYADAGSETKDYISLGRALRKHIENDTMVEFEPINRDKPKWDEMLFDEEKIDVLRENYHAGESLFIRIHVDVVESGGYKYPSYFDIALKLVADGKKHRPLFLRDGLVIAEEKGAQALNTLAMVIAEDSDLANFLANSENPSHTLWQADSLKTRYRNARAIISFIRNSVRNIVSVITEQETQKDEYALASIFPMERAGNKAHEKSQTDEGTEIDPLSQPQPCIIKGVSGGFKVYNGDAVSPPGYRLNVRVAYDRTKGNALKKYNRADFLLSSPEFNIEHEGLRDQEKHLNQFSATIDSEIFLLQITGFDLNRDLYVKADVYPANNEEED